jgi:glycogen operon protein
MILDVVYNHTAECNELGSTLSFKGIDNASYYRLLPNDVMLEIVVSSRLAATLM